MLKEHQDPTWFVGEYAHAEIALHQETGWIRSHTCMYDKQESVYGDCLAVRKPIGLKKVPCICESQA